MAIDYNDLQLLIIRIESEGLEAYLRENKISMYTYRTYQRYIRSLETSIVHSLVSSIQFVYVITLRAFHLLVSRFLHVDFYFKKQRQQWKQRVMKLLNYISITPNLSYKPWTI